MPKKNLLDMSNTSREEKTLVFSARTSGKETQEKNDSILCFFMWKMLVAKTNEENAKRWKGGQDMPDLETSREEKTLVFSARTSAKETQNKKGQHFVLLYMEMPVANTNDEKKNAGRGGQDMPDFERSRAEKNSNFSARTSGKTTLLYMFKCSRFRVTGPGGKGQHFVLLRMEYPGGGGKQLKKTPQATQTHLTREDARCTSLGGTLTPSCGILPC